MSAELLQYILTGLTVGCVYALVGLAFTIIYNATGVINFAQGEFVVLGALLFYTLLSVLHLPLAVALVLAVVAVALLGLLMERLAIRPLRHAPVVALVIVTVGVSVIIRGAARLIWGPDAFPVPAFSGEKSLFVGGAAIQSQYLWVVGLAVLVLVGVRLFFDRTAIGKAMQACAINSEAARLSGISVERMVQLSFALSAGVSALAGAVISPITFAAYDTGTVLGLKGFAAAIIGGLGNGTGAVFGGLVVGLLENLGTGLAPEGAAGFQDAFAFVVLVLMLFLKPEGLLGKKRTEGL
ncbi:branched-chain amino acid ABC transporter permease [bacterium]|nr:branched-chain amino acid ABC transporter permease [bacterium]